MQSAASHPFCERGAFGVWRIYFALVLYPTALHPPIGREAARFKKSAPPVQSQKLPRKTPAIQKSETNLHSWNGRGLAGKLGVGQGGLEGRATPTKGVALRLQGLPFPSAFSHSQSAPTVFLLGGKDLVAVGAETVLNIPAALHNDAGGKKNG